MPLLIIVEATKSLRRTKNGHNKQKMPEKGRLQVCGDADSKFALGSLAALGHFQTPMTALGCETHGSAATGICQFESLNTFLGQYAQIMELIQESSVSCPYCGESISILVDGSVQEQQYIEDCEVCCRPMVIKIISASGSVRIDVRREND